MTDDETIVRRLVIARLLFDIAGADKFGPEEVRILANDQLVCEIYDKLAIVAGNLRASLMEHRVSLVPAGLHGALAQAARDDDRTTAEIVAQLHADRPDMAGADCQCPTCMERRN